MSKRIVHTSDGRRAQRWQFHRGYIVESMSGRYIGAAERDGRYWTAIYGQREERQPYRYETLDHATRVLLEIDAKRTELARALGGKS